MAGLTLLTDPGNFRAFKVLIAAEYNGLEVSIPEFKLADRSSPAFLAKSPKVRAHHRLAAPLSPAACWA